MTPKQLTCGVRSSNIQACDEFAFRASQSSSLFPLMAVGELFERLDHQIFVPSQKHLSGFFCLGGRQQKKITQFLGVVPVSTQAAPQSDSYNSLLPTCKNILLTILSFTNLQKHSLDQIRICVILGRYAVGVHRRVDIYSIESAGVEYSIDMKVGVLNMGVSALLFSTLLFSNPSVVNSKTSSSMPVFGPNAWQRTIHGYLLFMTIL